MKSPLLTDINFRESDSSQLLLSWHDLVQIFLKLMMVLHKGSKGCHVLGRQTGKGDTLPEEIRSLSFKLENTISEDAAERFQEESCQWKKNRELRTYRIIWKQCLWEEIGDWQPPVWHRCTGKWSGLTTVFKVLRNTDRVLGDIRTVIDYGLCPE